MGLFIDMFFGQNCKTKYRYYANKWLRLLVAIVHIPVRVCIFGMATAISLPASITTLRSSSLSFIVRFPCYSQVGRFPPIKLIQLILSSANSFLSPRDFLPSQFVSWILSLTFHFRRDPLWEAQTFYNAKFSG